MSQQPKYTKTILCLANSRKMSGRCIAGREIAGKAVGQWIRPVSARDHQEISLIDRRYKVGLVAELLDIISIPMIKPIPAAHQTENHLIDDQFYWTKTGVATWEQVGGAIGNVNGPLWINGYSSGAGCNDRIPEKQAAKLQNSLLLVRPDKLGVRVASKGDPNAPGKRSVRALFSFNGQSYNLGLTDAVMEQRYLLGKNGTFPVADAVLCISLGEPFKGYVYKLAAALITMDRARKSDD